MRLPFLLTMLVILTPAPLVLDDVIFYGGDYKNDTSLAIACERNTSARDTRSYDDFDLSAADSVKGVWGNYLLLSFIPKYAYYEIRQGVREGFGGKLLLSGVTAVDVLRTGRAFMNVYVEFHVRARVSFVLAPGKYFLTLAPIGYGYGRSFLTATYGDDQPPSWDPNPPVTGGPIGNRNSFLDSPDFGNNFVPIQQIFGGTVPSDLSYGVGTLDTCAPSLSLADKFTVTRGVHQSGVLEDIFGTDDRRIVIQQRLPANLSSPSVQLVTETAIPCPPAQRLLVTIESRCTGQPSNRILQRAELFNFSEQRWETVDERQPTSSDTTFQISIASNPARFVEPGSNMIRTRLSWFDRGTASLAWTAGIDYLLWEAVP